MEKRAGVLRLPIRPFLQPSSSRIVLMPVLRTPRIPDAGRIGLRPGRLSWGTGLPVTAPRSVGAVELEV